MIISDLQHIESATKTEINGGRSRYSTVSYYNRRLAQIKVDAEMSIYADQMSIDLVNLVSVDGGTSYGYF
jgi:hypothetical protein